MAGWQVGGLRRALMESDEEFQEDEVWAVMDGSNSNGGGASSKQKSARKNGGGSVMRRFSSPRSIPRGGAGQSAPVDTPDWSKMIKKNKAKKTCFSSVDDDACDDDDHGHVNGDGDDDGDMVPPHEILARRFAKTQIASHSMCEGVGRTLKGRDLSKLRNAILTKTGFLE